MSAFQNERDAYQYDARPAIPEELERVIDDARKGT